MIRRLYSCFMLVVVGSTALAAEARQDKPMNPVVSGNTAFAIDLYAKLRGGSKGNLFFSPQSISSALAMTVAGAKGTTEAQMLKALHLDLPRGELHRAFGSLLKDLKSRGKDAGYRLGIADRLWGQRGYEFLPDFLALTRDEYDAELAQLEFEKDPEGSQRTINAWVADQTEGKIKNLIPSPLSTNTRLVLTDAVYFKAAWADPFNASSTRDDKFHLGGGEDVDAKLMHRTGTYKVGSGDGIKALEIGYKSGAMSMIVLLPDEVDGLTALEARLTSENLNRWISGLQPRRVALAFPRFKSTSHVDLIAPAKALGISDAFEPDKADFSGINGKHDLFISDAIHQAFVDVTEEGTEAAAATAIAVGARAAAITAPPIPFRADHPFIYLIRDNATGSILFLGRLMNPQG
ncbi:serpin family protein [Singulisphaera sp. PoT]|uniref:serpin family protein n=1 Tax=Singulisphaera sp. PoT TaxID=3411797 RepID=UPI003BF53D71